VTTGAAQLLRLLGSGVQPAAHSAAKAAATAGQASFADLLRQAREGTLTSNRPVTPGPDAGVNLSDDQLARLSLAADKLESAGVRTALVSIDGQKLILDVQQRQVTGAAKCEDGVISGVDGAIDLGDLRGAAQTPAPGAGTAPSAGPTDSASLMKLLAELRAA